MSDRMTASLVRGARHSGYVVAAIVVANLLALAGYAFAKLGLDEQTKQVLVVLVAGALPAISRHVNWKAAGIEPPAGGTPS